jgi:predicted dinucleotide-binding enzyme
MGTGTVGRTLASALLRSGADAIRGPASDTIFVAGDDAAAKMETGALLQEFGWPEESILDLGDITAARGMEMYVPLWLRLWSASGTAVLNGEVSCADAGR